LLYQQLADRLDVDLKNKSIAMADYSNSFCFWFVDNQVASSWLIRTISREKAYKPELPFSGLGAFQIGHSDEQTA
jgi:hypothetical protein